MPHLGRVVSLFGAVALLAGAFLPDLSVPARTGIRYTRGWAYEYAICFEGLTPIESAAGPVFPTIASLPLSRLPPLLPALFGVILIFDIRLRSSDRRIPCRALLAARVVWLATALLAVALRARFHWERWGSAPAWMSLTAPEFLFQGLLVAVLIGTVVWTVAARADVGRAIRAWLLGCSLAGIGLLCDWSARLLTAGVHPHLTDPAWGVWVSLVGYVAVAAGTLLEFPGKGNLAQRGRIWAATGAALLAASLVLPWNVGRSFDTPFALLLNDHRWWLDPEPSTCLRLLVALPGVAGMLVLVRSLAALHGAHRQDVPVMIAGLLWLLAAALTSFPLTPTAWSFRGGPDLNPNWEGIYLPGAFVAPLRACALALPVVLLGFILWAFRQREPDSRLYRGLLLTTGLFLLWQTLLALIEVRWDPGQWQSLSLGSYAAFVACPLIFAGTIMEFRRGGSATADVEREFGPRWGHPYKDRFSA
ncbi:MAG: hypothetical protein HYY93_02970 [Planctomycetes bacterium]|nr:hypothetical protein [Planctomycetota bacterium]